MKTKMKIFPPRISPLSYPNLGEDQEKKKKKKVFTKLGEDQEKMSLPAVCALKPSAQVTKRGGHAAILHTILC